MTKSNVRAARSFLEAFAADVRQAQTRDEFEGILDRWVDSGFPEADAYRGDFNRRGEIVGEVMKTLRALDGDGRALGQAERDRLPVLAGAKRASSEAITNAEHPNAADLGETVWRDGIVVPAPSAVGGAMSGDERSAIGPAPVPVPRPKPRRRIMANVENAAAPSVWDRPIRPEGGRLPFYATMPVAGMPVIRADPAGDGAFFGPRRNSDGTRRPHYGIDLEVAPGDPVLAPFSGVIESLGKVYDEKKKPHLAEFQSIGIRGDNGIRSRLFYVEPSPGLKVGDRVKVGQTIGTVQDRAAKTPGMDNHVHWELWTGPILPRGAREGGRPIDPTAWVKRQRLLRGHRRR